MNTPTFSVADAHKLEDPERVVWLPPEEVVRALDLRSGEGVADIGAGTGYFALPVAQTIGSAGRVFAVDFQTGMLEILGKKLLEPRAPGNITLVHGTAAHTTLAAGCADLVFCPGSGSSKIGTMTSVTVWEVPEGRWRRMTVSDAKYDALSGPVKPKSSNDSSLANWIRRSRSRM